MDGSQVIDFDGESQQGLCLWDQFRLVDERSLLDARALLADARRGGFRSVIKASQRSVVNRYLRLRRVYGPRPIRLCATQQLIEE